MKSPQSEVFDYQDGWSRSASEALRSVFRLPDGTATRLNHSAMRLLDLPTFLDGAVTREVYVRWLQRKAAAHVRRDRKRGNGFASVSEYKRVIHGAVCASKGRDAYTGEDLDWGLISKYDNDESKQGRRGYKAKFALLPTVDHVGDGTGPADFRICSWRTNDAKGDLTLEEFVALCARVLAVNGSAE